MDAALQRTTKNSPAEDEPQQELRGTRTQLSITDSMDTVKISQRFACANEQGK